MHIPGHLAIALSQQALPPFAKKPKSLYPLLIAALFPDIIDKTVGYILRAIPGGRHAAHNIFGLTGTSLLVSLVWGSTVGLAWFLGYLGHLIADNPKKIPWFFPVKRYPFKQQSFHFDWPQFFKETLFLAFSIAIYMLRQPGKFTNPQ